MLKECPYDPSVMVVTYLNIKPDFYCLDVIISVEYRVKLKKRNEF